MLFLLEEGDTKKLYFVNICYIITTCLGGFMNLNYIDYEFLKVLGINRDRSCFYIEKDKEVMKLLAISKVDPRKTGEVTDFFDGTFSTRVFTSSNCVLNVANKQNGKQYLKEIRVVSNNMLYTMKEIFEGYNKLKEVTITAGEYDKDDQVIVKVRFKDRFQPAVLMKTYIMRSGLNYAEPCYIDCTKNSSRLFDVGGIDGQYREEPVTGLHKATSRDYLFLLKESIDYSYLFPDNLKAFFRSMLSVFDLLYKRADERHKEQAPMRIKLDDYEKRMNRKLKEALKKRLEDPNLSETEKLDINKQYNRWLEEFHQELRIDVRTVLELPCEEGEIQHNK